MLDDLCRSLRTGVSRTALRTLVCTALTATGWRTVSGMDGRPLLPGADTDEAPTWSPRLANEPRNCGTCRRLAYRSSSPHEDGPLPNTALSLIHISEPTRL